MRRPPHGPVLLIHAHERRPARLLAAGPVAASAVLGYISSRIPEDLQRQHRRVGATTPWKPRTPWTIRGSPRGGGDGPLDPPLFSLFLAMGRGR